MTTNPQTDEVRAAALLVAEARAAVHESLAVLAAPEADRVRALVADLETAIEGRTAICLSAVSVPASAPTDEAALRDRIAAAVRTVPIKYGEDSITPVSREEAGILADAVLAVLPAPADRTALAAERDSLGREADRLRTDWVEMRDRAEKAEAAVTRVRSLHDHLDSETDLLASPDQEITRGAAARKIAAALDGYSPPADRAAILREAADAIDATREPFPIAVQNGITWATAELRRAAAASGSGRVADETQAECTASISGSCLREAESETACDTEAGECVHGGRPGHEAQQPETQAEVECANCWRLVENRGTPNMGGPPHDKWVHVPGGFQSCFPQRGADSPRAEPRPAVVSQPDGEA